MTGTVAAQNRTKTALGTPARLSDESHTSSRGHGMAVTPPHAGHITPIPPAAHHHRHHRVSPPSSLSLHCSVHTYKPSSLSLSLSDKQALEALTLPCNTYTSPPPPPRGSPAGSISTPPRPGGCLFPSSRPRLRVLSPLYLS
jgi:hypothetical protein